ncbi:MAG: DUF4097 family beta strand repeat protein [Candidatus Latescibacteria bacterium]|jgi:hypothetical protein|nr:DUF4097 family beta strand repeat protein [Candidatus Latescibacterota bacterium]
MKELLRSILMILLVMLFATNLFAENTVVKFTDPSKPGLIKTTGIGNITITGYSGSDVVIEIDSEKENVLSPPENEKTKGLKRISGSSVNIVHIKDKNAIEITRSMKHKIDLFIKVPLNTSFTTGTNVNNESFSIGNIQNLVTNFVVNGVGGGMLKGNIKISSISGDIEASTMEGDITLTDISGTVVVNTMSGNIETTFKDYKKDKPMSFSVMSGDIDVTLPSAIKADIKVKNIDGDVFTDFEIEMIPVSTEEQSSGADKIFGVNLGAMLGNNIYGKINGGGPEIRVTTLDGDIYVRKGK